MGVRSRVVLLATVAVALGIWALASHFVSAHCDTMGGPVVAAAREALEKGDVTPVLKWVKEPYEAEVRKAFDKALVVRRAGPEAKELADTYFFETLVRLHRAGEGAPYTGLKPADTALSPAVKASDEALQRGSVEGLETLLTDAVRDGLRERFARALAAKEHAEHSVEAGRGFVETYVEFTHYAERLYDDATGSAGHHAEAGQVHSPGPAAPHEGHAH